MTVVRKTIDSGTDADAYLPSVRVITMIAMNKKLCLHSYSLNHNSLMRITGNDVCKLHQITRILFYRGKLHCSDHHNRCNVAFFDVFVCADKVRNTCTQVCVSKVHVCMLTRAYVQVARERILTAITEGRESFHLS